MAEEGGKGEGSEETFEMRPLAEAASPDLFGSESQPLVGDGRENKGSLHRGINLLDATAMVVGNIIGSGIFITPAIILELTGSFGVSMLCWLAGVVIAVCGGLCFVELALLLPRTGGQVVYILEGFSFKNRNKWTRFLGQLLAFLYTWGSIFITWPASTSILLLTCTQYLTRPFYLHCDIPQDLQKCLALAILILLTIVMVRGVKMMAKVNNLITFLKVFAVVFIVIVGIAGVIQRGHFPDTFRRPFQGSQISSAASVGSIAIALYSVLFAFDGWNELGFAVEEIKKPARNLPRALIIGLVIISVSYFLVNLSFFSVLTSEEVAGTQAVALPFGEAVMGKAGLVIFPLLVAASTFGSSIMNMYGASRVMFSSAREYLFLEVFCGVHIAWGTPVAAIAFHVCLSSIYLMAGDIGSLIEGQATTIWIFYLLSFSSILIMRFTHREEKRPFKIWWVVPVVMIVTSVFLIVLPLARGPGWTLAGIGLTLTGIPVYLVFVMETPWRLRPVFLDGWSDSLTKHVNRLLQAKSARS